MSQNNNKNFIFLGIDPGFARTGYGIVIIEKGEILPINYGCVETSPKLTFDARLKQIHIEIKHVLEKYNPHYMCIEKLYFNNNAKTALEVGQARGVMLLTAFQHDMPIYEFTPTEVKQAITGYGKADKRQVQMMVQNLLKLKDIPQPDDAADALAIAWCGACSKNLIDLNNRI